MIAPWPACLEIWSFSRGWKYCHHVSPSCCENECCTWFELRCESFFLRQWKHVELAVKLSCVSSCPFDPLLIKARFGELLAERVHCSAYGCTMEIAAAAERKHCRRKSFSTVWCHSTIHVSRNLKRVQDVLCNNHWEVDLCSQVLLQHGSFVLRAEYFSLLPITCSLAWNKVESGWAFSNSQSRYLHSNQKFPEGRQFIGHPFRPYATSGKQWKQQSSSSTDWHMTCSSIREALTHHTLSDASAFVLHCCRLVSRVMLCIF